MHGDAEQERQRRGEEGAQEDGDVAINRHRIAGQHHDDERHHRANQREAGDAGEQPWREPVDGHWARIPPSTGRVWPVIMPAAGLARNMTAPTMSSGSASRPSGVSCSMRRTSSGLPSSGRMKSVRTQVGAPALTRMPLLAHSLASARVRLTTAPLLVLYEMLG